jgi:putative redox protein
MPQTQRVRFSGNNDLQLYARLEMPDDTPKCFATFSHCFTCTKDTLAAFRISKQLATLGIATLRFDFAGLGNSEGNFADTNFSTAKQDLLGAIDFLAREYASPRLLIGHSLGGTTALACAGQIDSVKGVVTIAAPSQPDHVLHHFGAALEQLETGEASSISVAGQRYDIKPQFIDDIRQHDLRATLSQLRKPVLIFNIDKDELVSADNALDIEAWAADSTTLITLEDTDHILSDKQYTEQVATTIDNWHDQFLYEHQ